MADEELLRKIQGLGDIDLAALLCLMSREHCIISTETEALDDLVEELRLVASQTFNLKCAAITCNAHTTLDDFAAGILLPQPATTPRSNSPLRTRPPGGQDSYFHQNHPYSNTLRALSPLSQISATHHHYQQHQQQPQIANIVLARDLDKAPKAVQIQALELLRTRRIFTRTSVQAAPKQFLFIAVLGAASSGEARLTEHLNDFFYISHWHDPPDGFAHLEDAVDVETGSTASGESVVRRSAAGTPSLGRQATGSSTFSGSKKSDGSGALFSEGDIAVLAMMSRQTTVEIDVIRYQMNIVSFLRMHRAVAGGIGPVATKHFDQLVKCLTTLHGFDYAADSMIELAAKKIYMHRIRIVAAEKERSMLWGSELPAIEQLLDGVGPEDVIDHVLGMVWTPV